MSTQTVRFPVMKYQALRSGPCPACGKKANRSRVFEATVNPFNKREDGTPRNHIEVLGQAAAMAEAWVPDFTHGKCEPTQ